MGAVKIIRSGNADKEFPALLTVLKKFFVKKLPWRITYAIIVEDVLCTGWQDNNFVLNLLTIHTVDQVKDEIIR